jgi:hypothetical protein
MRTYDTPVPLKPRRIELASTVASQDNQPTLADQQPEPQRKVA